VSLLSAVLAAVAVLAVAVAVAVHGRKVALTLLLELQFFIISVLPVVVLLRQVRVAAIHGLIGIHPLKLQLIQRQPRLPQVSSLKAALVILHRRVVPVVLRLLDLLRLNIQAALVEMVTEVVHPVAVVALPRLMKVRGLLGLRLQTHLVRAVLAAAVLAVRVMRRLLRVTQTAVLAV
jgi:hypothetical protein